MVAIDEMLVPIGMSSLSVVVALLSSALALLVARKRDPEWIWPMTMGVWIWGAVVAPAVARLFDWHPSAGVVMAFAGSFVIPLLVLDFWGTVDKFLSRFLPWVKPPVSPPPKPPE